MMNAAQQEMSINEYKVEPATNQCLTDFYIPEYPKMDDV